MTFRVRVAFLLGVLIGVIYLAGGFNLVFKYFEGRRAHSYAQEIILDHLVSPATAEFADKPARLERFEDGEWRIRSHVDSQNKFGAMIRTEWSVWVRPDGRTYRYLDY